MASKGPARQDRVKVFVHQRFTMPETCSRPRKGFGVDAHRSPTSWLETCSQAPTAEQTSSFLYYGMNCTETTKTSGGSRSQVYACAHTCTYTQTYTHSHNLIHTHTHVQAHTHARTHTRTPCFACCLLLAALQHRGPWGLGPGSGWCCR
eukprot:scaffold99741_cov19-Tisochrysis_lutea.AAC.2